MRASRRGFTLVELNISILFVALLILGIAMTTLQVTRMYQKGVTVKTVNQVGRDVFEQMRRDFASAIPSAVELQYVDSGRICLGSATYLFNDAALLNSGSATDGIRHDGDKVALVRLADPSGLYCDQDGSGAFVKTEISSDDEPVELLEADVIPLAIHGLSADTYITSDTGDVSRALYRIYMALGTNETETIDQAKVNCKPPTDNQANFNACFVSEFETVVRAGEIRQ